MSTTQTSAYPYFMNHAFWTLLRLRPDAPANLQALQSLDADARVQLVGEAVKGFYPVSYASLQAFGRFAELADDADARAIAREIHLVEKGEKPLIEGSDLTNVLHCDQLKILFESLLGHPLEIDRPETFAVLHEADIPNAALVRAMAICDLIENTAPFVIHFYQDFLLQCQVAFGVPSERLRRAYLDEHNLTEGAACAAQHIGMLDRMKAPYADLAASPEYAAEQARFTGLVEAHFERSRRRMLDIFANNHLRS